MFAGRSHQRADSAESGESFLAPDGPRSRAGRPGDAGWLLVRAGPLSGSDSSRLVHNGRLAGMLWGRNGCELSRGAKRCASAYVRIAEKDVAVRENCRAGHSYAARV
jgi:hypothetical protein